MVEQPHLPIQPRPWQFSLRTALLWVVLAAAAASMFVSVHQRHENDKLRIELVRLRNEVGELTIEPGAENKLHAISIPVLEDKTWKWRVYVPQGRQFGLQVNTKSNNSSGGSWSVLSPGETSITIALRRDVNDQWQWVIRELGDGSTSEGRQTASAHVEKLIANATQRTSGVGHATVCVEPGSDLELLKFEMSESNSGANPSQPSNSESMTIQVQEGPYRP